MLNMTFPAFAFGTILSLMIGSLFHVWRGGDFKHLLLYLIFGLIGFWGGHLAGILLNWTFFMLGLLHLGTALAGCVLFVLFAYWLGKTDFDQ